jgi:hypothetical protein
MHRFRSLIPIVLLLITSLFFAGCTRCVTCGQCPTGVTLESDEMCEDDFNTQEDFDQAVQLAEGFGCSCADS